MHHYLESNFATASFFQTKHHNYQLYFGLFKRTILDEGELLEFAKLGSYLEYDLFGTEMLNYPYNLDVDMPSDSQRVKV